MLINMNCPRCQFPNPRSAYHGITDADTGHCAACDYLLPENLEQISLLKAQIAYLMTEIDVYRQKKAYLREVSNKLRMSESKTPTTHFLMNLADDLLSKRRATLRGYVAQKKEVVAFLDSLLQNNVEIEAKNAM